MKTIKDLYKAAQSTVPTTKLLSDFTAEWWGDYAEHHDDYDRTFARLYYSFLPFMQSKAEDVDDVLMNFRIDVADILRVHSTEFEQLYRIMDIDPDAYSITDNYDMTETMDKDTSDTLGARSDSYTDSTGAQTTTATGSVAPFDSNVFNNATQNEVSAGARSDGGSSTKGAQSNSGTEDYTLHRSGNIGVSTSSDVMVKHSKAWSEELVNFYHHVFGVIAKELLCADNYMGGEDYELDT